MIFYLLYLCFINKIMIFRYVLYVRKNALQILIPKFGLEGTIYLSDKNGEPKVPGIIFTYNEEVSYNFFSDNFLLNNNHLLF